MSKNKKEKNEKTEDYTKYLNLFPLVTAENIVDPEPSLKGTIGFGEGLYFAAREHRKLYFYRFTGKPIPKNTIAYVTSEENHYSRQSNDRFQLAVLWDEQRNGFRVLKSVFPHGFKKEYAEISKRPIQEVVVELGKKIEDEDRKALDFISHAVSIETMF